MTQQEVDKQKDVAREHILESARLVFGRFGYKKTTLEDIARQAKKGKSSLYYYFNSKEEIFKEVVDLEASLLGDQLLFSISDISDPREKMVTYVVQRTIKLSELYSYFDAVKSSSLDELDFILDLRTKYLDDEISIFKKILQKGIEAGLFQIPNIELVARTLAIALKGYELPLIQQTFDRKDFDIRVREMIEVLCLGILSPEHR